MEEKLNYIKMTNRNVEKRQPPTATTTDLGIRLNGKMVLYLGIFGKSENRA